MSLHPLKTLYRLFIDFLVIVIAAFIVYVVTHKDDVVAVSVNEFIETNWGITEVTLDHYFKSHNLEPDEDENNN